jgi:TadE-like protein
MNRGTTFTPKARRPVAADRASRSLGELRDPFQSNGRARGGLWGRPARNEQARATGIDVRDERGQSMVEFTLVVPVLLLILFAIIQFGITFKNYVTLTDAVRAGARTAAVSRLSQTRVGDVTAKVDSSANDLDQSGNKLKVTVDSTWQHGDDVTVTATYPYSISLLGITFASGDLKSTTTERVE